MNTEALRLKGALIMGSAKCSKVATDAERAEILANIASELRSPFGSLAVSVPAVCAEHRLGVSMYENTHLTITATWCAKQCSERISNAR